MSAGRQAGLIRARGTSLREFKRRGYTCIRITSSYAATSLFFTCIII